MYRKRNRELFIWRCNENERNDDNDIKNEYGDEFNKELIHIDNLIIIET